MFATEQLTVGATPLQLRLGEKTLTLKAASTNTAGVFVGSSPEMPSDATYELSAGEQITLPVRYADGPPVYVVAESEQSISVLRI